MEAIYCLNSESVEILEVDAATAHPVLLIGWPREKSFPKKPSIWNTYLHFLKKSKIGIKPFRERLNSRRYDAEDEVQGIFFLCEVVLSL